MQSEHNASDSNEQESGIDFNIFIKTSCLEFYLATLQMKQGSTLSKNHKVIGHVLMQVYWCRAKLKFDSFWLEFGVIFSSMSLRKPHFLANIFLPYSFAVPHLWRSRSGEVCPCSASDTSVHPAMCARVSLVWRRGNHEPSAPFHSARATLTCPAASGYLAKWRHSRSPATTAVIRTTCMPARKIHVCLFLNKTLFTCWTNTKFTQISLRNMKHLSKINK